MIKHLRFPSLIIAIFWATQIGQPQSVIHTILPATPNGVAELSAALVSPCAVAADSTGNKYVGVSGTHQVFRIDPAGIVWLVAGTGASGTTGDGGNAKQATLTNPAALALDTAGNLYIADPDQNRVRRVTREGVITTFAGTGTSGYTGDGGPPAQANLNNPSGLAIDSRGNLLIADMGNHVIRMVVAHGHITTIAGTGAWGSTGDDGPALQASLHGPAGVATDAAGNVYIADTGNNWIRRISPDGKITRYAGAKSSSSPFGGSGDQTVATNVRLNAPTSMAVDSAGNLYFVESGANRVRKVTPDEKISTYAGTGLGGAAGDGGLARYANLSVVGIATDSQNDLLIADGTNNRVRIVTAADGIINTLAGGTFGSYLPTGLAVKGDFVYFSDVAASRVRGLNLKTGAVSLVAGNGQFGFSGDGGAAIDASLSNPLGLALDGSGNLYIADSGNHRVRRVSSDGHINTVAGNGTASTAGDGSVATAASLYEPAAVAVDTLGNFFVAEKSGHVVRKVSSGIISTVAGTGTAGSIDTETGVATSQNLNAPQGLALDAAGNLLISDHNNNRVRRLSADGNITTIAGSWLGQGDTGDGEPATSATLNHPIGIFTDATGNLYIADSGNHKIRRVDPDGVITTIAGTGAAGFSGDGSPATAYDLNSPWTVASGPACSVLVADTENLKMRQVWPAVDYTITSTPPGLQVSFDGQVKTTPITIPLLPGSHHRVEASSPQTGTAGTRYLASAGQEFDVACGPARATVTITFQKQYLLSIATDRGGTVTQADAWQDAGAKFMLDATPQPGYIFGGWEGACTGKGSCQIVLDGPKSIKADFAPAQRLSSVIDPGGIVGAGLSVPPVQAISPNGIATALGTNFAPTGTLSVLTTAKLVNGKISTEMDGVCILVAGTATPIFAVTPTQIIFQAPDTLSGAKASVQVVTGCGTEVEMRSNPQEVAVQSATPEFFYFKQTNSGQNPIAAYNASADAYVGETGLVPGENFAPAKPGDILTLYATGLGATDPAVIAGELPTGASALTSHLTVSVGTTTLATSDVLYAGVSPLSAGLDQINIRLPESTLDGNQPVRITVDGFTSPAGGYITVLR